jgi:DNA mismatch repair protein MLH1
MSESDSSKKAAAAAQSTSSTAEPKRSISVLPQQVVDQIAAGEVVQRPASVVKELLENCLDAGSTHIIVHVENGGLSKLSISDDGCGIPVSDLALAAARHATSKLTTVDDFASLETFGFRGEALASISMCSRLTVTTRTKESSVGFTQCYRNGTPTAKKPKPCARKKGTTITVQDLFHNVPHRLKTYSKRESDEYSRILTVVQHYSIHYPYTGFVCERVRSGANKTVLVDLNTSQLSHVKELIQKRSGKNGECSPEDLVKPTKQVLSHVFASNLEKQLSHFESSQQGKDPTDFAYDSQVFFTSPSHDAKTTKCVLFLNDRLVDLPALKRSLEDVYSAFTKAKPVLVVKVKVPGTQVDVNVHPSKRQVALMHQEELCAAISNKLREALQQYGQSFQAQSVAIVENPYARKRKKREDHSSESDKTSNKKSDASYPRQEPAKKKNPPNKFVRTSGATPVGAIEAFLVPTQPVASQTQQSSQSPTTETASAEASSQESTTTTTTITSTHITKCPLSNTQPTQPTIDLSQPGAFANLRCNCQPDDARRTVMVRKPLVRPKRVNPTKCTYSSLVSLRKRVNKDTSKELAKQFRDAYFVGVMSQQRSLIQSGEELVMIKHIELAKILFYQLALARFGGATMAELGKGGTGGVNVQTVIAQALQMEDDLALPDDPGAKERLQDKTGLLPVKEMNDNFAQEATACLLDSAGMLEEYFSIRIEEDGDDAILTGLPVLLDGHAPEPHGLPIFLFRLATQVDWTEERPCFQKICEELGNYYAMLPTEGYETYVRHTLFPALSYLLLPTERVKAEGNYVVMTKLSTLYKVFERC